MLNQLKVSLRLGRARLRGLCLRLGATGQELLEGLQPYVGREGHGLAKWSG